MTRPFKLKPWTPTENDVQKAVIDALSWEMQIGRVVWAARVNGGVLAIPGDEKAFYRTVSYWIKGQKHTRGFPDIVGQLSTGRFFAFELKSQSGKLSEDQKRFLDNAVAGGALAAVVRSADEAIELIRGAFQ